MDEYIVVLITAPSKKAGAEIARALLEQRLAACVNIVSPVESLYVWKGEIHDDEEVLLIAKTKRAIFEEELVPAVRAIHPYEIPEIIALPIVVGSRQYLDWIDAEVAD